MEWFNFNNLQFKSFFIIVVVLLVFVIILFKSLKIDFITISGKNNVIKVAFYCISFKYGGVERVTSILLNYLSKEKKFNLFLITKKLIEKEEYNIPNNVKRISLKGKNINLIRAINMEHIDILV